MIHEYIVKKKSTGDIAVEFGVTDAAIIFWLKKVLNSCDLAFLGDIVVTQM